MYHIITTMIIVAAWVSIPGIWDYAQPVYEADIVDGWHEIPEAGIVHLEGTAWLDTTHADLVRNGGGIPTADDDYPSGRIVLAAHNPGDFAGILDLREGDLMSLRQDGVVIVFEVIWWDDVSVEDIDWLMPTDEQHLTLITCNGELRRIVDAVRVE
jgi:sortase (surface protein transpeptidase)